MPCQCDESSRDPHRSMVPLTNISASGHEAEALARALDCDTILNIAVARSYDCLCCAPRLEAPTVRAFPSGRHPAPRQVDKGCRLIGSPSSLELTLGWSFKHLANFFIFLHLPLVGLDISRHSSFTSGRLGPCGSPSPPICTCPRSVLQVLSHPLLLIEVWFLALLAVSLKPLHMSPGSSRCVTGQPCHQCSSPHLSTNLPKMTMLFWSWRSNARIPFTFNAYLAARTPSTYSKCLAFFPPRRRLCER